MWNEYSNSLCCAIKLENDTTFIGDYQGSKQKKKCNELFEKGSPIYGGKVEYVTEIPNRDPNICEVTYEGVCCHLPDDVTWYPKVACNNIVEGIQSVDECKQYAKNMSCFFRDGRYMWLPKAVGNDSIVGVSTQIQCESRNNISTYDINLHKGVNIVGFDFSPSLNISPLYASSLLKQYPDILLIGNYQGYGWEDLVKQSNVLPYVGQDFYFEQNKGYLIYTDKDLTLTMDGWQNPDTRYQQLEDGWNLVGGSIYSKSPSTSALISNLKENEIDIQRVGIWANDLGSFIFNTQGDVQGVDIKIEENQGIFLKK